MFQLKEKGNKDIDVFLDESTNLAVLISMRHCAWVSTFHSIKVGMLPSMQKKGKQEKGKALCSHYFQQSYMVSVSSTLKIQEKRLLLL